MNTKKLSFIIAIVCSWIFLSLVIAIICGWLFLNNIQQNNSNAKGTKEYAANEKVFRTSGEIATTEKKMGKLSLLREKKTGAF